MTVSFYPQACVLPPPISHSRRMNRQTEPELPRQCRRLLLLDVGVGQQRGRGLLEDLHAGQVRGFDGC